jgi:tetratricopeptide (TPR) repeat protein
VDAAIRRVQGDLEEQPDNTRYLTQLGDLYRMKEDWDSARKAYEKAHELDPQNFQVQERLGDLKLAELDAQIKELKEAGEEEKAKAIQKERTEVALEDFQKRARARPQDFTTRYKLANILFQLGRYKEAATEYQHASRDPKTRRPATYRLGLCLEKQGMTGMAIEQYEKAAQGASVVSQEVKDVLYTLGSAYEREGQIEKALGAYKRVFDTDMNFKDVSTKIEELYQKGAKQAQEA